MEIVGGIFVFVFTNCFCFYELFLFLRIVIVFTNCYCYCFIRRTVGVNGLREGGDVRGCLLTAIKLLESVYEMHTYPRCEQTYACEHSSGQQHALSGEYMLVARREKDFVHTRILYQTRGVNLTRQLVKQVRELFSPPESGMGFRRGTLRSGDKKSQPKLDVTEGIMT